MYDEQSEVLPATSPLDQLKAKLDERAAGGKSLEQNLHAVLTHVHDALKAVSGG